MKHIQQLYDSICSQEDLYGVPHMSQIFLNISSDCIHLVWSVNVRDIWSASVFFPGIWLTLIHIPFSNTQFQISLAISLDRADLVPPIWLIYEMAVPLSDLMPMTLFYKSLQKDLKQNLIAGNAISLIWQFCPSMDHLPLIKLTPFVPSQPVLLASVYMRLDSCYNPLCFLFTIYFF